MPFGRRMRRRRPMMRAPIVSYKHQRQTDVSYVGTDANQIITYYTGTSPGGTASVGQVPAGNKVFSVNASVNFTTGSGSTTSVINWMLVHLRADQDINTLFAAVGAANWSNIGNSLARNQVIKSYLAITGTEDSSPTRWNVHIPIPKMWHRVREGDSLVIVFNAVAAGSLSIGTRYKSFS